MGFGLVMLQTAWDATGIATGVKKSEADIERFGINSKRLMKSFDEAAGKAANSLAGLAAGYLSISYVFGKVSAFVEMGKQEFLSYADAVDTVALSMQNLGKTPLDAKQLEGIGRNVSDYSNLGYTESDVVRGAVMPGITNGVDVSMVESFSKAAADLAALPKFGGGLEGLTKASEQLTDMLHKGTPSDELIKAGVEFTKTQLDQIKTLKEAGKENEALAVIVGAVTSEFGGLSAKTTNVYTQMENWERELSKKAGEGATDAKKDNAGDINGGPSEEAEAAAYYLGYAKQWVEDIPQTALTSVITAKGAWDDFWESDRAFSKASDMEDRLNVMKETGINTFSIQDRADEQKRLGGTLGTDYEKAKTIGYAGYAKELEAKRTELEKTISESLAENKKYRNLAYVESGKGILTHDGEKEKIYREATKSSHDVWAQATANLETVKKQIEEFGSLDLSDTTSGSLEESQKAYDKSQKEKMENLTKGISDAASTAYNFDIGSVVGGFSGSIHDLVSAGGDAIQKSSDVIGTVKEELDAIESIRKENANDPKKMAEALQKHAQGVGEKARKSLEGLLSSESEYFNEIHNISDRLHPMREISKNLKKAKDAIGKAGFSQEDYDSYRDKTLRSTLGITDKKTELSDWAENAEEILKRDDISDDMRKSIRKKLTEMEDSALPKEETFSRDGARVALSGSQEAYSAIVGASQEQLLREEERRFREEQRAQLRSQTDILSRIEKLLGGTEDTSLDAIPDSIL